MSEKLKTICSDLINKCINEIKDENNMDKIKKDVLDPCVQYILKKIYPYILITCIIFVLIFLMTITILIILIFNKKINSIKNNATIINN
jgi:hypothetical protein